MENKLSTIERITEINPHNNADSLEIATVLGWKVCVKKGEFKAGDLVIYGQIDTIFPEKPEFEFLRNKNFRIKQIKLRGQPSAGICFPVSILPPGTDISEGMDVSEILGVKHYEKPIPAGMSGKIKGQYPHWLRKTDELNGRSYSGVIEELKGKPYFISSKQDGSSSNFFVRNGEFGLASRNFILEWDENGSFTKGAMRYNLKEKLIDYHTKTGRNIALNGELIGPGCNGNVLKLKELEVRFFNLWDIDSCKYLGFDSLKIICEELALPMVEVLEVGDSFNYSLEELIEKANKLEYSKGVPAEGIVIRPIEEMYSKTLDGRLSFKIINENYKD